MPHLDNGWKRVSACRCGVVLFRSCAGQQASWHVGQAQSRKVAGRQRASEAMHNITDQQTEMNRLRESAEEHCQHVIRRPQGRKEPSAPLRIAI
jgi:hypothetical protein